MSKAKSFVLYGDFAQHFSLLTDSDLGLLFRSVFDYVNTDAIPQNLPPAVAMAFSVLRVQIDRDREKYIAVCKKRAEAGKIGGQQRAMNAKQMLAKASKSKQIVAKQADSNNENKSESDTKNDNEKIDTGETAPTRKRFTPPDEQTVCDFFKSKGSTDAEARKFHDFYKSKGWRVGTAPMRDWESAARNWLRRNNQYQLPQPTANDYDISSLLGGDY